MSTPEIQLIEEMFAAFAAQDVERAVRTVSEDTVWIHHGTQKLPAMRFVGAQGVRQFFEINFTTMKVAYFRVLQLYQAGHVVIARGEEQFTMAGREGDFTQQWVQIYTIERGRITRMEEFASSAAESDYQTVA